MILKTLREEVWRANIELLKYGLVTWTSGNVIGRDPESGLDVIKPGEVMVENLTPEDREIVGPES